MGRSFLLASFLLATSLAAAGCFQGAHDHPGGHAGHTHGQSAHSPAAATLIVRTDPAWPQAGEQVTLHLMIHTADGRMVKDFDTVHEAKVHLIVVRDGLDRFAHLHPEADAAGNLTVTYSFPVGGTYRLFADYAEAGKGPAVATGTVKVGGDSPLVPPLAANVPGQVGADGVEVDVAVASRDNATELGFTIAAGGRPVDDLRPYLGALGHLTLVSADGTRYVHVHPAGGDAARGTVEFVAHFPEPGVYKGWGQFKRGGRVRVVPLVVKVG
jgi:hypothetical protein